MSQIIEEQNPLGTERIGKLIPKFAIPSIISMVVSSLYNIVDQIFIGQGVGMLGNAATNIAFPVTIICTATALLLGIGSASNYNLASGEGEPEKASAIAGTGLSVIVMSGVVITVVILIFLDPLLQLFGVTPDILPYAQDYVGITAFGLPFYILINGGTQLIRADRSPTYSMVCMLTGTILNTILDPLFIFVFDWGIQGAAAATVIGQFVSGMLVIVYFLKFQKMKITRKLLIPKLCYLKLIASLGMASFINQIALAVVQIVMNNTLRYYGAASVYGTEIPKLCYLKLIASLGMASFINQIALAVVQIVMNNTLRYYGAASVYGTEIPLACVGVIAKVNMIFISICIGLSQGCQPIWGFNYGAKAYERVKETYKRAFQISALVGGCFFICFQIFPRTIVSIFGSGSELYFDFAEKYFRIFMFMTFANGLQPISSGFFTSIGKAKLGIFTSLTRQVMFLIPLILIFSLFFGINGVMYAGPIADLAAAVVAISFAVRELKKMKNENKNCLSV